ACALLDRRQQIDFSWSVNQIPADPQWRGDSARRIKIQAERFGQLQQGDPITVPRRNQLRDLIVKLDLRLENVEPWNGSGFKTILLIFQLTLQQIYRLLLHYDQLAIDDHLIKLRLHRRDDLIDRVSQREVSRIALEEGAANCAERAVIKNQLCSGDLDVVRDITAQILDAANAHAAASATNAAAAK